MSYMVETPFYLQILGIDLPQERVEFLLVFVVPVGDDDDDGQDHADAPSHAHDDLAVGVVLEAELALQSGKSDQYMFPINVYT